MAPTDIVDVHSHCSRQDPLTPGRGKAVLPVSHHGRVQPKRIHAGTHGSLRHEQTDQVVGEQAHPELFLTHLWVWQKVTLQLPAIRPVHQAELPILVLW